MDAVSRRPQAATLLSIPTDDGWDLDALLVESQAIAVRRVEERVALVYLHGKGHDMLTTTSRFLAPRLPEFSHLSLNTRAHGLAYMTGRPQGPEIAGGMHESNRVGHLDVAAAVRHLRERGHRRVVLIGHSSGGWYAGEYGHHGEVDARILLSPLTDNRTAFRWWFADDAARDAALARAAELVALGRPDRLIEVEGWYHAISAASLLERASDTDDRWIDGISASASPVLLLWGSLEDRDPLWRSFAVRMRPPVVETRVVEGSDHYFWGYEDDVAAAVEDFLRRAV